MHNVDIHKWETIKHAATIYKTSLMLVFSTCVENITSSFIVCAVYFDS